LAALREAEREQQSLPPVKGRRSPAKPLKLVGGKMTAEIAVLNRAAVALAADSATTLVTPFGPKINNNADKLFPFV